MKTMILSKKSYDWKVLQLWCRIFAWLIINPHSTIIYFNLRLSLDSEAGLHNTSVNEVV
jgi:hypothetical protein